MTPSELLSDIEKMDFDYFIQNALDRVPEGIDTREGSVIYDALAPSAYSFAEVALQLHNLLLETYTQTAQGEFLDYRAAERGIKRQEATYCQSLAKFTDEQGQPFAVPIGTRFASVGVEPIYYKVIENKTDGSATLQAETAGNNANRYVGQVLPIDNMNGFGYGEITSVEIPARDAESDESLRTRILEDNTFTEYGGNVSDYMSILKQIDDVGAGQVYPTWQGGGTVKLVILNNEHKSPSQTLIDNVQNLIDPVDASGDGYGLAPIGHTVTVAAPTARTVSFDIGVDTISSLTVVDVTDDIKAAIEAYFNKLRSLDWAQVKNERHYSLTLYRSQIMSELLKIEGVVNVSSLLIDGTNKDIEVVFTNDLQELPIVGEVVVHG